MKKLIIIFGLFLALLIAGCTSGRSFNPKYVDTSNNNDSGQPITSSNQQPHRPTINASNVIGSTSLPVSGDVNSNPSSGPSKIKLTKYLPMINKTFDISESLGYDSSVSAKMTIFGFESVNHQSTGISDLYALVFVENAGKKDFSFGCSYLKALDSQQREFELEISFERHFDMETSFGSIQPGLAKYFECHQEIPLGSNLTELQVRSLFASDQTIIPITQ